MMGGSWWARSQSRWDKATEAVFLLLSSLSQKRNDNRTLDGLFSSFVEGRGSLMMPQMDMVFHFPGSPRIQSNGVSPRLQLLKYSCCRIQEIDSKSKSSFISSIRILSNRASATLDT